MSLSELLLEKIKKRVIDNIALLSFDNKSKYERNCSEDWVETFSKINIEELEEIINIIYKQQSESIELAMGQEFNFIKLLGIGSFRLNTVHRDILKYKRENAGNESQSEINLIIQNHFERKLLALQNSEINIPININEKKTT